jgi:hypothetical protein
VRRGARRRSRSSVTNNLPFPEHPTTAGPRLCSILQTNFQKVDWLNFALLGFSAKSLVSGCEAMCGPYRATLCSVTKVMSSSCSQPSPAKVYNFSIRNSTSGSP